MGPFHLALPLPRGWRMQIGWNTHGWFVRSPLDDDLQPAAPPELSFVHSLINLSWDNYTPSLFSLGTLGSLSAHLGPLHLRLVILRHAHRTIHGELKQFFVQSRLARWHWYYNLNRPTRPLAEISKHLNYHHFIVGLAWINNSPELFSRDKLGMLVVHLGPVRIALHCPAPGQFWNLDSAFMA